MIDKRPSEILQTASYLQIHYNTAHCFKPTKGRLK